ncbi:MAG TPA: hypothetical protein VJ063_13755 [Verrucomicrobiae bacterium]|nr:hypothetical protein [Verrucomicrobiae bacterium]
MAKILLGDAFISLTIISPDTGSAANQLVDQPIIRWVTGDLLGKADDGFAEPSRAFLQIKWMSLLAVRTWLFIQYPNAARIIAVFKSTGTSVAV